MKRTNWTKALAMGLATLGLLHATAGSGLAFGRRHGGGPGMMGPMGGPGMLPLPVLLSVMTPDQRQQLRGIMETDRPAMRQLVQNLRAAQDALASRVFTPGALTADDLAPQLAKIAGLRDQLVQQALATTLRVRALLTPDQLAEAAKRRQRLGELRDEERSLMGGDVPFDQPTP